jgi:hypothetical protein
MFGKRVLRGTYGSKRDEFKQECKKMPNKELRNY